MDVLDLEVTPANESRWLRWIGEGLESGRTEQVLRNAGSTVLSVMRIIGFSNPEAMTDTWARAYSDQFPDWESSIGAYEFPMDVYTGRIAEYVIAGAAGVSELAKKPAMLLEGMADEAIRLIEQSQISVACGPTGRSLNCLMLAIFAKKMRQRFLSATLCSFCSRTRRPQKRTSSSPVKALDVILLTIDRWPKAHKFKQWGGGRSRL